MGFKIKSFNNKKFIGLTLAALLALPAVLDAIRYLKPDAEKKKPVQPYGGFRANKATEIILVYNAWGGIYPGVADIIHKEFFPKSYPCNLCFQTFGTFGMKKQWKNFLEGLPFKITELHKEQFRAKYDPEEMQLPAILLSNGNVQLLLSANGINKLHSVEDIITAVKEKVEFN